MEMDRGVLNKATSADDIPTPGYMFGEISKMTFADVSAPQQLADYLLNKLQKDNPHVKLKCLRIIKHVSEQGKADFRRCVAKKAEVVKACLMFRGTPDPLKGDAPNKMVREEADACVKAVFNSDASCNAYGQQVNQQANRMQGFGSETGPEGFSGGGGGPSSFGGGGGGGGTYQNPTAPGVSKSGAGNMVGFGNPNFDNTVPSADSTITGKLTNIKSSALDMGANLKNWTQAKISGTSVSSSTPGFPGDNGVAGTYRSPAFEPPNPSGGFGGGGVQGRWGAGAPPPPPSGPPRTSQDGGAYEQKVVDEVCAPGGARVAPSAQVLQDFCKKCESLESAHVSEALRKKLEQPDWQTRLKALCAIDSLIENNLDGIVGNIVDTSSDLLFDAQGMAQCRQRTDRKSVV